MLDDLVRHNIRSHKRIKMGKRTIISISICIVAILFSVTTGFAANSLTFNETYQQTTDCFNLKGVDFCNIDADNGNFSLTGKISLSGIDISKFNDDTVFVIEAGGFYFDTRLGEDWLYAPGKTSFNVSFVDRSDYSDTPIKYITLKLKWSTAILTVTIKGLTPDMVYPIIADYYLNATIGNFADSATAYIQLGDELYAGFNVYYSGKLSVTTSKKKGITYKKQKIAAKGKGTETSEDFRYNSEEE